MVVCLLKAHLRFRESFVNPLIAECARFFNSYEFSDRYLTLPPNVTIGELAPRDKYHQLVRDAVAEVVPLYDTPSPVGSSQIVFAMMMGKAIVATRTGSTIDYIEHGKTGLLVKPGDAAGLHMAIQRLLDHPDEVIAMGRATRRRFEEQHTFEAFARRAYEIMGSVVERAQHQ